MALHRAADSHVDSTARIVDRAFNAGRRTLVLSELAGLIEDGKMFQVLSLAFGAADRIKEVLERDLPENTLDIMTSGAEVAGDFARRNPDTLIRDEPVPGTIPASALPRAATEHQEPFGEQGSPFTFAFDVTNPEATRWATSFSSGDIVEIDYGTRVAVRQIVRRAFTEGLPPMTAARLIREEVGLTDRQDNAVFNLRERMRDPANRGKTVRAYRARDRFTQKSEYKLHWKIPKNGPTNAQVENAASQYAKRLRIWRSRNIARTETIAASNEGQRQLWLQSRAKGDLPPDVERVWIVTMDNRLCPICAPMHSQHRDLDEQFVTGDSRRVMAPPAHPMCRCATGLSRAAKGAPASTFAPDLVKPTAGNLGTFNVQTQDILDRVANGEEIGKSDVWDSLDKTQQKMILDYIERAEGNFAEYRKVLEDAAAEIGYSLGSFKDLQESTFVIGKTKAPQRAAEKIVIDYEGNIDQLSDVLRSTFVIGNPDEAVKIYELMQRIDDPAVFKDRMLHPMPGGYRDALMKLRLGDGMLAEVQVNTIPMLVAKNGRGHELYKIVRKTLENSPKWVKAQNEMEQLYAEAWAEVCGKWGGYAGCTGDVVAGGILKPGETGRHWSEWSPDGKGWPSAPSIGEVADLIRGQELERGASWGFDGSFLGAYTSDDDNFIFFPPKIKVDAVGGSMLHNHPGPTLPFSFADLTLATRYRLTGTSVAGIINGSAVDYFAGGFKSMVEERIGSPGGFRTPNEWSFAMSSLIQNMESRFNNLYIELNPAIQLGISALAGDRQDDEDWVTFATRVHRHATMEKWAFEFGLVYQAEWSGTILATGEQGTLQDALDAVIAAGEAAAAAGGE